MSNIGKKFAKDAPEERARDKYCLVFERRGGGFVLHEGFVHLEDVDAVRKRGPDGFAAQIMCATEWAEQFISGIGAAFKHLRGR